MFKYNPLQKVVFDFRAEKNHTIVKSWTFCLIFVFIFKLY